MPRLRVMKGTALVQELSLDPGSTYLAGRADSCQIRLDPEPGISRQHFQISQVDGQWKLEVLSRYGELYVNGTKTPTLNLSDGSSFSVPPYEFVFGEGSISASDAANENAHEATQVAVLPSQAMLRVMDERGTTKQVYRLEGEAWTAGRDAACVLHLDTNKASRQHFEIYREGQNYFVRDLGSANGTSVNGHSISKTEWTKLQSGDTLTVVDWSLRFEVRDSSFEQRFADVPSGLKAPTIFDHDVPADDLPQFDSSDSMDSGGTHYGQMPPEVPAPESWQQVVSPSALPQPMESSYLPPPQGGMGAYAPPPPPAGAKKKVNVVRWLMILIVVGAGVGYFLQDESPKQDATPVKAKSATPFDALAPEDQQFVKRAFENARQNLMSQKYAESLQELNRMKEKVPYYEDSREVEKAANEGLARIEQLRIEDNAEKAKLETEAKIQEQVKICRAQINPKTIEMDSVDSCLSNVLPLNPDHPAFATLRAEVTRIIDDRNVQKAQQVAYQGEVHKLEVLYKHAREFLDRQKIADGMDALKVVIDSKLPDPHGLRAKAREERDKYLAERDSAQKALESSADAFQREGHYKEAIHALRKALDINPENEVVKGHLAASLLELRKLMQPIYQEAIVEESVGQVEKAKEMWKKIQTESITGEEYYEKSRIKLKKYGVL